MSRSPPILRSPAITTLVGRPTFTAPVYGPDPVPSVIEISPVVPAMLTTPLLVIVAVEPSPGV